MVEITERRLKELERIESKMTALESAGVDNWDFYDDALKVWHAQNELEERREALISELAEVFGECAYEPSERGGGIAFNDEAYNKAMKLLISLRVIFEP